MLSLNIKGLPRTTRSPVGPLRSSAPRRDLSAEPPWVLTTVYLLQREVPFQVPPELHLIAILSHSTIIRQDKVGVHAVECCELAEGVSQSLVQAHYLQDSENKGQSSFLARLLQRPVCALQSSGPCQKYYQRLRAVPLGLSAVKPQSELLYFVFFHGWVCSA